MKKKDFLTIAFLAITTGINAQEAPHGGYLFKEFTVGIGKKKTGVKIRDRFNYDIVKQELHFIDEGEVLKLDMPELDSLFIENRTFVQNNGKFAECFTLSNGLNLQVFWHSRRVEKGKEGAYGISTQAGGVYNIMVGDYTNEHAYQDREYKDISTYNFIPDNLYVLKIKNKTLKFRDAKSFAKVFKLDETTVKDVMKSNNWSFARVTDVIELLNTTEFKL